MFDSHCHLTDERLRDEVPQLLGFTNYPWNKIARTDHYRRTGLRYGATQVHNDVLGHWLTLVDAETILLIDQPLCTHIVGEGGRNLTNRESRARLSLIDALDETWERGWQPADVVHVALREATAASVPAISSVYSGFMMRTRSGGSAAR